MRLAAIALLVLVSACARTVADSGATCELNSDCRAPLVCAGALCRPQCRTDRDCASGETCHAVGDTAVCVPPAMPVPCAYSSQCGDRLSCVMGTCRATCLADRDCGTGTCIAGACSVPIVAVGSDAGDVDAAVGDAGPTGCTTCGARCVDTTSDREHCGSCGNACASGETCSGGACIVCVGGACPPPNDQCDHATPLTLVGGAADLAGSTAGADITGSTCLGGRDVFYRFDIATRSAVFANSFMSAVSLLADCGGVRVAGCGGTGSCLGGDFASFVTVAEPGTYYLDVEGDPTDSYRVQVFTLPLLAAPRATLNVGAQTFSGSTATGRDTPGTCGGGHDDTYLIFTCSNFSGGPVDADTCTGTSFDTVLELDSGSGVAAQCGDADACGVQSRLSAWLPAGAGLYALRVDGATATDSGDYTLNVTLPTM